MALPKLSIPEFFAAIPSTDQEIKFRPFLVKEEKILYMALEGNNQRDIFNAIMNIIQACVLTPDVNFKNLTSYDLEYLFLMLRSKSVSEIIQFSVGHSNSEYVAACDHTTKVQINIDDLKVKKNPDHNHKVMLNDSLGIKLKDPQVLSLNKNYSNMNEIDRIMDVIYDCVEYVYDADTVYEDFTKVELKDFIENLSKEQFERVVNFFNTMPKLSHEITFTCEKCNNTETVLVEGLQSFFM